VLAFEQRIDVAVQRQLDRFARGTGRRDHHHAAPWMEGVTVGVDVDREDVIAGGLHWRGR